MKISETATDIVRSTNDFGPQVRALVATGKAIREARKADDRLTKSSTARRKNPFADAEFFQQIQSLAVAGVLTGPLSMVMDTYGIHYSLLSQTPRAKRRRRAALPSAARTSLIEMEAQAKTLAKQAREAWKHLRQLQAQHAAEKALDLDLSGWALKLQAAEIAYNQLRTARNRVRTAVSAFEAPPEPLDENSPDGPRRAQIRDRLLWNRIEAHDLRQDRGEGPFPEWRAITSPFLVIWHHLGLASMGEVRGFAIHLDNTTEAKLKADLHPAATFLKEAQRRVRKALGRAPSMIVVPELEDRLHFHVFANVTQAEAKAASRAFRLAGGLWDPQARCRQVKVSHNPDVGMASYYAKEFWSQASGRPFAVTRCLTKRSRMLYESATQAALNHRSSTGALAEVCPTLAVSHAEPTCPTHSGEPVFCLPAGHGVEQDAETGTVGLSARMIPMPASGSSRRSVGQLRCISSSEAVRRLRRASKIRPLSEATRSGSPRQRHICELLELRRGRIHHVGYSERPTCGHLPNTCRPGAAIPADRPDLVAAGCHVVATQKMKSGVAGMLFLYTAC